MPINGRRMDYENWVICCRGGTCSAVQHVPARRRGFAYTRERVPSDRLWRNDSKEPPSLPCNARHVRAGLCSRVQMSFKFEPRAISGQLTDVETKKVERSRLPIRAISFRAS